LVSDNAITGSEEKVMAVTIRLYRIYTELSLISDGLQKKIACQDKAIALKILTRFGALIL
jgi:hypothetical protein